MEFTTLWNEQKEDDCYLKSEKLFHSYLEREQSGSLLFGDQKSSLQIVGARKNRMTPISREKKMFPSILEKEKSECLLFGTLK